MTIKELGLEEEPEPEPEAEPDPESFEEPLEDKVVDEPEGLSLLRAADDRLFRFVGGPAGSGKTFLFKALAASDSRVQLVSTTGIAAINLGGTTINSALGYFDTGSLKESYVHGWVQAKLRKYRSSGITRWVLDEASMLDGDQLTLLVRAIEEVNKDGREEPDPDSDEPYARYDRPQPLIGLTLVGDFAQLPPVKARFAFEVDAWSRFSSNVMMLSKIWRQADEGFINALRCARKGDGLGALEFFRDRLVPSQDSDFDGPTILAKNDEVDRYNLFRFDALRTPIHKFISTREGKPRSEWKQIPEELDLREGALVMVLANRKTRGDDGAYLYVNGDLGTFEGAFDHNTALVRLKRTGEVAMVTMVERENLEPTGATGARKERFAVVGSIRYMPMRLAWATTVHKSQGLSLDKVQVSLGSYFFSNPGSVYVALSRARTADGLRLVAHPDLFVARCKADARVARWL